MKRTCCTAAIALTMALVGCGRDGTGRTTSTTTQTQTERTTTHSAPADTTHAANRVGRNDNVNVNLDERRDGSPADGTVAGQDGVDVTTTPDGGVNVNVKGEPVRDLIRERREATIPR